MIKKILRKNRFTSKLLETYFISQNYLKSHGWYESRFLMQAIDENKQAVPWFTYSAIHFIEEKLKIKPMKVFEYGSGNSTLWFSLRVESIVSVEHHQGFYTQMLEEFNKRNNILYEHRTLDENYSTKILEYENEFDIIIVDGRERVNCIKNSIKALRTDGVIIFDNSERESYKEARYFLTQKGFKKIDFKGHAPIIHGVSQTTIYYRDENCFNI